MDKQENTLPTDQFHRKNAFVKNEKVVAPQTVKKKIIKLDSLMPNIPNPFQALI